MQMQTSHSLVLQLRAWQEQHLRVTERLTPTEMMLLSGSSLAVWELKGLRQGQQFRATDAFGAGNDDLTLLTSIHRNLDVQLIASGFHSKDTFGANGEALPPPCACHLARRSSAGTTFFPAKDAFGADSEDPTV